MGTTHEEKTAELRAGGWHVDPQQPQRWRHPDLPALDPLTTEQALELSRAALNRQSRTGAPPRTH